MRNSNLSTKPRSGYPNIHNSQTKNQKTKNRRQNSAYHIKSNQWRKSDIKQTQENRILHHLEKKGNIIRTNKCKNHATIH